jgi:hypothetical protein
MEKEDIMTNISRVCEDCAGDGKRFNRLTGEGSALNIKCWKCRGLGHEKIIKMNTMVDKTVSDKPLLIGLGSFGNVYRYVDGKWVDGLI